MGKFMGPCWLSLQSDMSNMLVLFSLNYCAAPLPADYHCQQPCNAGAL
jgi:hypothetical protein